MTIFIVFNRYNRDSFNNNVADIPGHFGRPAMSARFKVYHRSYHLLLCYVMLFEYIIFKIYISCVSIDSRAFYMFTCLN